MPYHALKSKLYVPVRASCSTSNGCKRFLRQQKHKKYFTCLAGGGRSECFSSGEGAAEIATPRKRALPEPPSVRFPKRKPLFLRSSISAFKERKTGPLRVHTSLRKERATERPLFFFPRPSYLVSFFIACIFFTQNHIKINTPPYTLYLFLQNTCKINTSYTKNFPIYTLYLFYKNTCKINTSYVGRRVNVEAWSARRRGPNH